MSSSFFYVSNALHILGFTLLIAGVIGTAWLLVARDGERDPEVRARLARTARKRAVMADVGGAIALLFGLHMLFAGKFYLLGYMHLKLALVVGLIVVQVLVRLASKRAAQGSDRPFPRHYVVIALVLFAAIVGVVTLKHLF